MNSRNDPNNFSLSSFNVKNQSGNGGFGRPYSQGNPSGLNNPNTRGMTRATNQQPFQQNSQGESHSLWSVSPSIAVENLISRVEGNSEGRRPDLSSIESRDSGSQGGSQESEQQYFARWHKNIDLEEAKDEEEPCRFVDVEKASHMNSQAKTMTFQRLFPDKYQAKEFLKAAKDLSGVSCESLEDHIYEGTVKQTELKENKSQIECYVEVEFSREKYQNLAKYVEIYRSQWKIKEKKIAFYHMMRENLSDFKETSRHKEILIKKASPAKSQKMSSKIQALYENFVEKNPKLNNDQKSAIKNCLLTTNYNLVLGMPGTGKTEVIAALLKILIESGQKVLVTAYTHSAVDNMLKRFLKNFKEDREKILRLGTEDKIDKEIVDLVYKKPPGGRRGEEELIESKMIFAVTCLGIGNKILRGVDFASCIVDEASQIVEPVIIGPLIKTPHFVLFGDHNQLPPLVKSDEAKEGGMGVSLFEKLAVEHINSISYLTIQYRMNQNIMRFSNEIIYERRMTCANELVKNGKIQLQSKPALQWVADIFDPSRNVVFLDLGRVGALYDENSRNLNCSLTCFLARELKSHGMREEEIGIITPLRSDRNDVDTALKDLEKLNRYTIDTCQGIDKSCIIMNISLDSNRIRPLLSSSRRVNVAFTRSKHKLIIIGSFHDLKDMEGIGSFIRKLDRERDREIFDFKMLKEAKIIKSNRS